MIGTALLQSKYFSVWISVSTYSCWSGCVSENLDPISWYQWVRVSVGGDPSQYGGVITGQSVHHPLHSINDRVLHSTTVLVSWHIEQVKSGRFTVKKELKRRNSKIQSKTVPFKHITLQYTLLFHVKVLVLFLWYKVLISSCTVMIFLVLWKQGAKHHTTWSDSQTPCWYQS